MDGDGRRAERFQDGRVFLIGDAAHVMPPYGGYGGNTGIHDAQNLAWKLATVLDGGAGSALLATYDPERRPVARFTVRAGVLALVTRAALFLRQQRMDPVVGDPRSISVSASIRAAIAGLRRRRHVCRPARVTRDTGHACAHLWRDRAGAQIATQDLFGASFVLLTGPGTISGRRPGKAKLVVHRIGAASCLADAEGGFPAAYGITPAGAVLVRPDGFVVWRALATQTVPRRRLSLKPSIWRYAGLGARFRSRERRRLAHVRRQAALDCPVGPADSWPLPASAGRLLFLQGLDIRSEGLEVRVGDDSAPVRHRHERRPTEHAAGVDEVDDLCIGIELAAELAPESGGIVLSGAAGFGTPPRPFGPWQLMQPYCT